MYPKMNGLPSTGPLRMADDGTGVNIEAPEFKAAVDLAVSAKVTAEIEKATTGLRTNEAKLKIEKTAATESLRAYTNLGDIEKLTALVGDIETQQLKEILKEKGINAFVEASTASMRADHARVIKAADDKLAESEGKRAESDGKINFMEREEILGAAVTKANVRSESRTDAMNEMRNSFDFNTNENEPTSGKLVTRDAAGNVRFGVDGTSAMSPFEFIAGDMKDEKRQWWAEGQGADSTGNNDGGQTPGAFTMNEATAKSNPHQWYVLQDKAKAAGKEAQLTE